MRTLVLLALLFVVSGCIDPQRDWKYEVVEATVIEVRVSPSSVRTEKDFSCQFSVELPGGEKRTFFSRSSTFDDEAHRCSLFKEGDKEKLFHHSNPRVGASYYEWHKIRER